VDPHEIGSKWVFDDMWDFTDDVSQPVLLEFFKALIVCANADGEITDAERAWCIGCCAATGATPETLSELQSYDGAEDILEVIERGRHLGTAHRPVIYDSIRACNADGDLSDPERATILKIAAQVRVRDEEFAEFERIYAEDRALREKRIKAVFPIATPY
jgi:tellurite resistance protein